MINGKKVEIVTQSNCRFEFTKISNEGHIGLKEVWMEIRIKPDRNERLETPVHLYQMLVTSEMGVEILKESGHIEEFEA
jgi:hypothetical protein